MLSKRVTDGIQLKLNQKILVLESDLKETKAELAEEAKATDEAAF